MSYTAHTYVRTGPGPHRCPTSWSPDGTGHDLIVYPERGNPHIYVCPFDYDQERSEAQRAQIAAEEAAELAAAQQAQAERIARKIADAEWSDGPVIHGPERARRYNATLNVARAAALAALSGAGA